MSRSRRKPWVTDGYKSSGRRQWFKNYANRVVRHAKEVPDGKAYKKLYCSYNICDYKWQIFPEDKSYDKITRK